MRVNACNMLRQAAETIENRKADKGAYAFMLEQLSEHLGMIRDGQASWDEFAELYCLTERDRSNPRRDS